MEGQITHPLKLNFNYIQNREKKCVHSYFFNRSTSPQNVKEIG